MGRGMVADLVSGSINGFNLFRVFLSPEAAKEECGFDTILVKCGENKIGFIIRPGGIDGQRSLFIIAGNAVYRQLLHQPCKYCNFIAIDILHSRSRAVGLRRCHDFGRLIPIASDNGKHCRQDYHYNHCCGDQQVFFSQHKYLHLFIPFDQLSINDMSAAYGKITLE